jgi:NDP-sugar pyrophosphorylase family protein
MVPALVLTAGLATRLRPLSFVRAKAALPVAGIPIVRRILRWLAAGGVIDVVLNLHHLPHTLTTLVGDGSDLGLHVRYSWETPVLGSAGGPKRALPLLQPADVKPDGQRPTRASSFLIVNGDTLTDVNLGAVVDDHQRSGALVTIAVVPNTEPDKYGGALVNRDGTVTGFAKRGSAQGSFHVIGVQVAEPEAFASVPADIPFESTRALYPSLIQSRPGTIRAFHASAEFFDIGTPADYLATSLLLAEREAIGLDMGARHDVSSTARVERSILWDDVVVGDGAMLKECVVTDGVHVPADTSWHGVTIRTSSGELAPGERRINGLAIASL